MTERSPFFSIIVPVFNTDEQFLSECIASVLDQDFPDWELILVDDASSKPVTITVLELAMRRDPRIRVIRRESNGGIVHASNTALQAARGDWLVLADHDDALEPSALAEIKNVIDTDHSVDYIYTDEFHLQSDGTAIEFQKPDWSPERLRSQMYTCHISAVRRALSDEIGGFRTGFDGAQDYDFVLRITERARRVRHIRKPLYYWRVNPTSFSQVGDTRSQSFEAGRRAVQEHCDRTGIQAVVEHGDAAGVYRVKRKVTGYPRVAIIVPTRGSDAVVWGRSTTPVVDCLRSVRMQSTYQNFEYVVVADTTTPPAVRRDLSALLGNDLTWIDYDKPFNFSDKINRGVASTSAEFVLLLNDDTLVIHPNWFEPMLAHGQQPDVGTVGNMLLFADSRLQCAGHMFVDGNPTHVSFKNPSDDGGFASINFVDREVSGNTGACMLVRRSVFFEVGGLSLRFGNNYNDVDFAMKVTRLGLRHIWTPQSKLFHFESLTRDPTVTGQELNDLHDRWSLELHDEKWAFPSEWDFGSLPPRRIHFRRRWNPRTLAG